MYLEGSDQHRGWFHSSLLESVGTRGRAPYESVLTHGFVVDGKGRKMSKSLGNFISPDKILEQYGVDILRLWVVASDYYDDLKLDKEILKAQTDSYRRIRNTFRYLIGNLNGFDDNEKIPLENFPELEKYILHRLWEINQTVKECVNTFNFHLMFTTLLNFCSNDLSAFYFDIRKDSIYCDSLQSVKRRAARTLLDLIFNHLVRWLAPSLVFTCEEAWKARGYTSSIHLEDFVSTKKEYQSIYLKKKWDTIRNIRKVITGALEKKRAEKIIGSSLEAHVKVFVSDEIKKIVASINLDEIAIISSYELLSNDGSISGFSMNEVKGVYVQVEKASGDKCNRCWKFIEALNDNEICNRCKDAIQQ